MQPVAAGLASKTIRVMILGATALAGGIAFAPVQARAGETTTEELGGIQNIVVTARKRAETTQDAPVSVVAISAERIQRYDLTTLERVAAQTPSFVIGRAPSGAGATLVMRGIGSNTTSIGLEQSVAVVADGAYYGQGRTINEGFFDLGRMEILKGPQALFFGKNATAGVVSITSADPGDKLELMGRLGYEFKAEQVIGEAVASGPVNDKVGLRVAVRASDMNKGYFDNIATTATYPVRDRISTADTAAPTTNLTSGPGGDGRGKEFYIRTTVKAQPNDRLTATLKANFGNNTNNNPAANSVLFACPTGASAVNPALPCARKFQSSANLVPTAIAATLPYVNSDGALGDRYRSWAVTGNLNYELDHITLTSVTNYNWNRNIFIFDGDSVSASGPQGVFATEGTAYHAFSSELRALTHYDSPFNGMIGAYYQSSKRDYLAYTASGGLENTLATPAFRQYLANSKDSKTKGETLAVFGQVIWKPIDKVEISGGVRYTHETKDSYFVEPYSHPIRVAQGVFLPNTTITANQKFNNASPEATVSYKPNQDINLYASYKTGYKSGGFSNSGILSPSASVNDFAFRPETVRGFEGGIKSLFLDRQVRLNLGLYTYRFRNLQIDFFNSPVFAFSTINAGSATTKGVEVEFEYAPRTLAGFNLHGSINYDKARYGNVPNAPCWTGMTIAMGCTIPAPGARPQQNLAGQPTADAPEWTGSLGVSYETEIQSDLNLGLSVDGRYSSSYIATAFGNAADTQSAYMMLDASARIRTSDERWEFAIIGKNLTNRWVITGGTDAPNTGARTGTATGLRADQIGFVSAPRTVQMQVTWKY
ncbi:MAG: ligand-gated channel [Rhodospirillaceae bacterium]|nr:MAG: ligand-gated channel [Rhodospirillaceae bacterium]